MKQLPTLRREIIAPFAVFFAGAFSLGILSIILIIPRLPPARIATFVGLLLLIDVLVFALLAVVLLRQKLFMPILTILLHLKILLQVFVLQKLQV